MGEVEVAGFGGEGGGGDEAFDGGAAGVQKVDGGADVGFGDAETGAEFHEIGGGVEPEGFIGGGEMAVGEEVEGRCGGFGGKVDGRVEEVVGRREDGIALRSPEKREVLEMGVTVREGVVEENQEEHLGKQCG